MGGFFSKPKAPKTAKYIERPGVALMADMPQFTEAARQATAERLRNIAMVVPGAEAARRGEIPEDVRQQTMRSIAEFGGAGFDPTTAGRVGGFQAAQALVPRQFGLLSTQMVDTGLRWSQLADAYDPFKAAAFSQPSQRYGETTARAMAQDFALQQEANEMFYNRMLGAAKFATNIIGGSRLGGGDQGGGGGMDFFAAASKVFGKG